MKIARVESFLLHIPLDEIADSKRTVTRLEFAGVRIFTDSGLEGTGYVGTVGYGGLVLCMVIDTLFADELIGEDPLAIQHLWDKLYSGRALWIGRSGAVTMAQAAVDIALWDIAARNAEKPLWQLLAGERHAGPIPIYNTHGGWLNFSTERLIAEARALLDQGYGALKMKVGGAELAEDIRRVEAVRAAIGDDVLLMADANQNWDLAEASAAVEQLEPFNLGWIEEPLHPDDISGHVTLRARCPVPLALGEAVYSTHQFRDFIDRKGVDVVQVDACRVGGITKWLEVAAMAEAAGLKICPHAGDLGQVHQHLVRAIAEPWLLEVIPVWQTGPFERQIKLVDGANIAPQEPGASTRFSAEAFEHYRVA